jgi:hypothetical protein
MHRENSIFWSENVKEIGNLEDIGKDGRIILKRVSDKLT